MRALIRKPAAIDPRPDPAPSRLAYRLQRLWLTPAFRRMVLPGLPLLAGALASALWLADPGNREGLADQLRAWRDWVAERPEFRLRALEIHGASAELDADIREVAGLDFPISSFDLDLEALRARILELEAVADVSVRLAGDGVIEARVRERVPALVWRGPEGLELIDADGHRLAELARRTLRPDLPLVVGEGAPAAAREALALWQAVGELRPRVRGLRRMGERRWDLVLDRGQVIRLPEGHPVEALERLLAMEAAGKLLERDVAIIDLRLADRPTVRLRARAGLDDPADDSHSNHRDGDAS